ncbi:hypothetical protein K1T35_31360 [Pseudonocardia sp. DSM 110487]|uniref:hypothetical protein n=1 Tax=Pseudonocardia sp. DSM 110487 TaxID=2865833 RepID=UPI001C695887|nr:hypothetical protein [Pseudonocardia sp. DSM 110487]QYN33018.1 hypothetical protein K1T35_31360 [Pseudonocardia sp. DSM 110487]
MTVIERVERDVRGSVVAILWVLAAAQGMVGTWALVAPLVFYEGFPLPGHAWVALLPPFNEHLVRDVGALNLALAAVLAGAALRADRATVRLAAIASLVAAVPHAAYHALHLSHFPPADAVAQTVATVLHLALLVVVLRLGARLERS